MAQLLERKSDLNSRIVFSSTFDPGENLPGDWDSLTIRHDQAAGWVTITRSTNMALFGDELEKLRALVRACAESDPKGNVVMCLQEAQQIFLLHINHPEVPAGGWVVLDETESYLAHQLNGIIYAPGEGFFDSNLHPIPLIPAESVIVPIHRPQ